MFNLTDFVSLFLPRGILYLGPETIMPLASILAAIVGFFLLFGRSVIGFFKKIIRKRSSPSDEAVPYVEPEDEEIRPS